MIIISTSLFLMHTAPSIQHTEGLTCTWSERQENKAIPGNNQDELDGTTEEECKKACEKADTFVCLSVDWRKDNGWCALSTLNSSYAALSDDSLYVYWGRSCSAEQSTTGNYYPLPALRQEILFSHAFVCLSVCLSVHLLPKYLKISAISTIL